MWWEPTTPEESEVLQDIRRVAGTANEFSLDSVLGIGSIGTKGRLNLLLLLDESFFPLATRSAAKIWLAGIELSRGLREDEVAETYFLSIEEIYRYYYGHYIEKLGFLIDALELPLNTVTAFISKPRNAMLQHHPPAVNLDETTSATLGVGFESNVGQQFTTARHIVDYSSPQSPPTLNSEVSLSKSRLFGLIRTKRPFGVLPEPKVLPSHGDPDIAVINPFHSIPTKPIHASNLPSTELEVCKMYGAKSRVRQGWKSGAISHGPIAKDWPKSWFIIGNRLTGLATQGDSGARVHNSANQLIGHIVATSGIRTFSGRTHGAIVQDFAFQRNYVEHNFGVPRNATLIAAT